MAARRAIRLHRRHRLAAGIRSRDSRTGSRPVAGCSSWSASAPAMEAWLITASGKRRIASASRCSKRCSHRSIMRSSPSSSYFERWPEHRRCERASRAPCVTNSYSMTLGAATGFPLVCVIGPSGRRHCRAQFEETTSGTTKMARTTEAPQSSPPACSRPRSAARTRCGTSTRWPARTTRSCARPKPIAWPLHEAKPQALGAMLPQISGTADWGQTESDSNQLWRAIRHPDRRDRYP